MKSIDSRIELLIVAYLAKDITKQDEAELLQWINTSSQNKAIFDSYQNVWNLTKNSSTALQIDCDCDWQTLKNKIFTPKSKSISFVWLSRIAAIFAVALLVGALSFLFLANPLNTVRYVANNGIKSIVLPDSSCVILNKDASIEFNSEFVASARTVNLTGEAFFQVTHKSNSKFVVETQQGKIIVLGTRFSVKALENSSDLEVKVESGKVQVYGQDESLILTTGQKTTLEHGKLKCSELLNSTELNWKSSNIVFKAASLKQIVEQLKTSYSLFDSYQIVASDTITKVTTSFQNQSLDEVLSELSSHFGKKFTLQNRTLVISN